MKIRHLILALAMGAALPAAAQGTANYLHIRTSAGWEVLSLDKVDRLTFDGITMTASDSDNKTVGTFAQSELQTMYIDGMAGIEAPTTAVAGSTFTYNPATRIVTMLADGSFTIYNTAGTALVNIEKVAKGEVIDLKGLENGIVILSTGNYSLKTVIK